jgi:hypothetical protein
MDSRRSGARPSTRRHPQTATSNQSALARRLERVRLKRKGRTVSIYVNRNNTLELAEPLSRECPHCGAHAQLLPAATPAFEMLTRMRPKHVGIVFCCAACNEPRFLRAAVRAIDTNRIELASNLAEVERPRERFQFGYLPQNIEPLFRETLDCYTAGVHNAFAAMCRRSARVALAMLDGHAKRRWQDAVSEVLRIGEVDAETARTIETVLFDDQGELPMIGPDQAAVLIEVIKDLFYQSYVRTAKLRAAMKMRRFFADEGTRNVTPIDRGRRELA